MGVKLYYYKHLVLISIPVDKCLFKVSKITLEQRSLERCSNVILLTLNRHLSTGIKHTKHAPYSHKFLKL